MDDDHPADIGRPRRHGDRTTPPFVAAAYDRLWHSSAVPTVPSNVGYRVWTGRHMLIASFSHFDPELTSTA